MSTLNLLCLVVALVCFTLAAVGVPSKVDLSDAGLGFLTLSFLVR